MSKALDNSGVYLPHPEGRSASGSLGALNAEVVLNTGGDSAALVYVVGRSPVLTVEFSGSVDGVNYFPIYAVPFYGVGGTVPSAAQPLLLELYATTMSQRVYQLRTSQLTKMRVRASTYTSGNVDVWIQSDMSDPLHRAFDSVTPSTLCVSTTAAVSTALTATLPSVTGLRHYITRIQILRSATAALTASATPTVITTTNLPGSLAFTMGLDASGIGIDKELVYDFGSNGFPATAVGTATTVVAPIVTGAIWRINVFYRLGA